MYPWTVLPILYPKIPTNCDLPPTIFSIMNSIANFDNENPVKIQNLANASRNKIFDFDYPLSTYITKEDFECMILNKFIMRRIGYDTLTAFKIALMVKLNEIMPVYNKLFDALDGWTLFTDGEEYSRILEETKQESSTDSATISSTSGSTTTSSSSSTSDRRFSDTPENALSDVRDGNYVTNYNYDTDSSSDSINVQGNNNSTNNASGTMSGNNRVVETTSRTPADKIKIYNDFLENRNNIYSLIFKDLECLFYGLV